MRVLIVHPGPQFSVSDVCQGWIEGLSEHTNVFEFNLGDRLAFYDCAHLLTDDGTYRKALAPEKAIELAVNGLAAALFKLRPDVLLVVSAFFADPQLLEQARRLGTRVVMLHTESPYEDDRQLALAELADLTLLNDPTNLELFRQHGRAEYMPHAYRPGVHHPGPADADLVCDLAFVGTGYPSRVDFLTRMDLHGLDVVLGGNWQHLDADHPLRGYVGHDIDDCLDNTQTAQVYRSMRVGLNLYRRESQRPELAEGWAMGPREVELAACGAFFLREHRGESDEVLPMLPAFTSPEEAGQLLRYWLTRADERARLAHQARSAIADRTFTHHAARLMRLIERM